MFSRGWGRNGLGEREKGVMKDKGKMNEGENQ
jgi:hypothetical protein